MKMQTDPFWDNALGVEHVLASNKNIAFWIEELFMTQVAKTPGQKQCLITTIPAFSLTTGETFGFQKDSEFLGIFNSKLKKIREAGLHYSIKQSWVKLPTTNSCIPNLPIIDFQKTIILFLIVIFGIITSIVLLFISHVQTLFARKKFFLWKY